MTLILMAILSATPLTTVAERSGWTKTGRVDEVVHLCAQFPLRYPGRVKCLQFGTSPQGRPMLALVASADGTFSESAVRAKQRPVVLIQGGIHAGEIDGKDAGFWLLREVLEGRVAADALRKLTLVFVPVFNIDGHERFGPNQRPNQRGPEETGWRATAQNLNLNRDYMKADAPEMVAMLGLLHRFDPILYVDLHVTDGAKFQHDVAVTFEPQRIGPEPMRSQGQSLATALFSNLSAAGHLPLGFYPAFEDSDNPLSGFASSWPPPRFGNAYWSLHHRFGVLVETHSWQPYGARVKSTFDVCAALLVEASIHGTEWRAAGLQADAAAMALGGQEVPLMYEVTEVARRIDFLGYQYTRTQSEVSGKFWVQYDENQKQVWKVPLRDELKTTLTVRAPRGGYLIPGHAAGVVRPKLIAHGLKFEIIKSFSVELVERITAVPQFRTQSYEGHHPVQVSGQWEPATEVISEGSLFVPIDQPHAEVVMHLLEPTAPDSLVTWGFFNAYFEQKEYLEDYLTEEFAREQLRIPEIKAQFEAQLKDARFAASPEARLAFFAQRHPSFDTRMGVVPVYRIDEQLGRRTKDAR
jgi:hypothetical protein